MRRTSSQSWTWITISGRTDLREREHLDEGRPEGTTLLGFESRSRGEAGGRPAQRHSPEGLCHIVISCFQPVPVDEVGGAA